MLSAFLYYLKNDFEKKIYLYILSKKHLKDEFIPY